MACHYQTFRVKLEPQEPEEVTNEICQSGADNEGEPACQTFSVKRERQEPEEVTDEICQSGADNEGEPACQTFSVKLERQEPEEVTDEICQSGADNEGEPACQTFGVKRKRQEPEEVTDEICQSGADNEGEPACQTFCAKRERQEPGEVTDEICQSGADNEGEPACQTFCAKLKRQEPGEVTDEICQSGSDNEGEPELESDDDREDERSLHDDVPPTEEDLSDEEIADDAIPSSSNAEADNSVKDEEPDRGGEEAYDYDMETDKQGGEGDTDDDSQLPWVRNLSGFPAIPKFTGNPGINVDLGDDPQPIDVYKEIIDDSVITMIRDQTNQYAKDCIAEKRLQGPLEGRSVFATWKEVTEGDIYNFLAICLHMGLVKKPQINDYWSTHPGLHSSYAVQIMPRDRFLSILTFLHLNNNNNFIPYGQEGHDPIFKIRPFMTHLQEKFQQLYTPKKEICVDEAMCPFKGRSRFLVYMKEKSTRWGFKFYELCESRSGYVYRFEMFCAERGVSNKPHDVVMRLVEPLLKKGYHLYMDNHYCEPGLCATLAKQHTMACGTVRQNRLQMPRDLGEQPMARGQVDYRRRGSVVACRWKDKKDVFMLSTMHKPDMEMARGRFEAKNKPKAVISYIENVAGVDKSDRLLSYFPMHRKSVKWWKKPFFHLLTLCTIQTMILLNKHRQSRKLKRLPLDKVIKSLLLDLPIVRPVLPESAAEGPSLPMSRLQARHFPALIPPTANDNNPRKNCHVCYAKQKEAGTALKDRRIKRTRTHYQCPDCKIGKNNSADGAELSKDILAPADGPRENLVVTAVKFLQNPKVRQSPLSQKKAFLERKGLTSDEIQLAVQRAGVTDDPQSLQNVLLHPQQQPQHPQAYTNSALVPAQQPLPPPLPVSPWTRTREIVTTAAIVAAVSYAVYNVFKNYIRPWLMGKSESEARMQRLETSITQLQASVAESNAQLVETLRAIQESLTAQKDSNIQNSEISFRQETHTLNEIKSEVSSLKALLLNRRQFPPPPVTSPIIPAWQKTAILGNQTPSPTAETDAGQEGNTGASAEHTAQAADAEKQKTQPLDEHAAPSVTKPEDSPQFQLPPPGGDAASSPSNSSNNGFELVKPSSDSDTAADLD